MALGNIRSVSNALTALGATPDITRDPARIAAADGMILPGVGAFPSGMELLHQHGLVTEIHKYVQTGKPFLGICLGMQLLFDKGTEFGTDGRTEPGAGRSWHPHSGSNRGSLPHIAWKAGLRCNNAVPDAMFAGLNDEAGRFYHFVRTASPPAMCHANSSPAR